jgi:hypothetical protein
MKAAASAADELLHSTINLTWLHMQASTQTVAAASLLGDQSSHKSKNATGFTICT